VVAPVVGDQRAEETGESDPWAHLQEEARLVRALDARDKAADGDPHGGEDRRQEQQNHRPVVPGPIAPLPEQVVADGEDEDQDSRQDSGQSLAGSRRDPERERDGPDRQVARRGFSSSSCPSTTVAIQRPTIRQGCSADARAIDSVERLMAMPARKLAVTHKTVNRRPGDAV
jgi:hypothetical protein